MWDSWSKRCLCVFDVAAKGDVQIPINKLLTCSFLVVCVCLLMTCSLSCVCF